MQIREIAWEEFESRFLTFCDKTKKKSEVEMGVAYTTRFNTIYLTRGYKVFECGTKYLGGISQNARFLITAPPSG